MLFFRIDAENGLEMVLLMNIDPFFINLAIQMDGKAGYNDRIIVEKNRFGLLIIDDNAPCNAKVAIEPGVKKRPPINFCPELPDAMGANFGSRFNFERRAIGMACKKNCLLGLFFWKAKCRKKRILSDKVVALTRLELPFFPLFNGGKVCLIQVECYLA